jgi:hypothetical protein
VGRCEVTRPQATPDGGPYIGGRRAAVMLGVDERTVHRWAELDHLLPVAYTTAGGHRRYRLADVEQLAEGRRNAAAAS